MRGLRKTGAIASLLHIFSRPAQGQLNVLYLAQYSLLFTLASVTVGKSALLETRGETPLVCSVSVNF